MRALFSTLVCALASVPLSLTLQASGREPLSPIPADRPAPAECLPLTPRHGDGNFIVPGVLGDVVYRRVNGQSLSLDLYAPADGVRRPLVVVVHGGAWRAGSRAAHVGQFLELLARHGYAWASIDYRMGGPGRWQEAAEDVRAAVAFLRCHARDAGFDAGRLALLGEDAGAQLVGQVAAADASIPAVVLVGGFYDLTGVEVEALDAGVRREASLVAEGGILRRPAGRALVIHGSADTEAPHAQASAWCDGVGAAGGRCELVTVDGGIHRAENWRPAQWDYKARLASWLAGAIGAGTPAPPAPAATGATGVLHKDIVFDASTRLALDAWIPDGPGPHTPVLLLHGGGWEAGDKVTYITPLFEPLARAGFAWFSMDYRLTPDVRHPAQLDDLRAAIRFLRAESARFGIDPERLVLVGESASAQMVTQVAIADGGVAGVVSFYGVYDFLPFADAPGANSIPKRLFGLTTIDDVARDTLRRFSPLHQARRDQPPILLVHGTGERLWEQGTAMAARLRSLGAPHTLLAVEGAPHGIENWEGRTEWQGYKPRVVKWIAELAQ